MGVRGRKSKIEEKRFVEGSKPGHGELTAKKWLDSIEKQKRRSNLKFVTDRQSIVDNNDS